MMAFQSPGVQVLGLTTIFGNCTTEHATRNALILVSSSTHSHGKRSFSTLFLLTNSALSKTDWQCEKAGHPEVPVAEGSHEPLKVLFILHVLQFAGACLRNSCEIRRFCVPSCGINLLLFLSVLLVQRHYMEKNQCNYIMYIIWMYKIFFSEFRVHFYFHFKKRYFNRNQNQSLEISCITQICNTCSPVSFDVKSMENDLDTSYIICWSLVVYLVM